MKNLMTKALTGATAALVSAMLLAPANVYAVVKSFQVMQDGQPVANTQVTLVSPSGKSYTETTDAGGKVVGFNFNEDGDWKVSWAGGAMTISAGGGIGPWIVVPTAIGVTAAIIAANDSDNDDSRRSSPPPDPEVVSLDGTYTMDATQVVSNPDNHPNGFQGASCAVTVAGSGVTLDCDGDGISVTATGSASGSDFNAAGVGSFAGNGGVEIQISGTLGSSWNGNASAGANGALPDNNNDGRNDPIEVTFSGSGPTEN
ncbi:MAG: hypothetical protein JSV45_07520 [Chromatiales bacterium]|nr:MAG: hypothetical protein JSV45_07520 [Chromatiales bacterium]